MKPLISVIVPCFGVEKYLDQCIKSLVSQTIKDIEIILVDDESPDRVPEMCDEWKHKDKRIKVIHKSNGGLGMARNTGLEVAEGKFVAFLDSDDFVDSEMYETLYAIATKENADACYCGYSFYDGTNIKNVDEGITEYSIFNGRKKVDQFLFSMIGMPPESAKDTKINMCVWRALYRRDIIQRQHILFVSERVAASEDVTFHASFLPYAEKVCFTPKHLYRYRYNPHSISHSYPDWKRKSLLVSCELVGKIFSEHYSREYYIDCYRRHLFRNLKTIIRKETQRESSIYEIRNEILNRLNNPVFSELFDKDYAYNKLPLKQKMIYILCKYRLVLALMALIKLTRK